MKNYLILPILFFCISGCSTLDNAFSFVDKNPEIVNIATRQAVFRYVEAGMTTEEKDKRASKVYNVVKQLTEFLDANPEATVNTLLDVLNSKIDWQGMKSSDVILVQDIMTLVQISLKEKQQEELIQSSTIIKVKTLLTVIEKTAQLL